MCSFTYGYHHQQRIFWVSVLLVQITILIVSVFFKTNDITTIHLLEQHRRHLVNSDYDVIAFGTSSNESENNLFYYDRYTMETLQLNPFHDVTIFMETQHSEYSDLYFYQDIKTNISIQKLKHDEMIITQNAAEKFKIQIGDTFSLRLVPQGTIIQSFTVTFITSPYYDLLNPNPSQNNGLIVLPFSESVVTLFPSPTNERFPHIIFSKFGVNTSPFFYTQSEAYSKRILKETINLSNSGLNPDAYYSTSQLGVINDTFNTFYSSQLSISSVLTSMIFIFVFFFDVQDHNHLKRCYRYKPSEILVFKTARSFSGILLTTIFSMLLWVLSFLMYSQLVLPVFIYHSLPLLILLVSLGLYLFFVFFNEKIRLSLNNIFTHKGANYAR
jgi:hypothetical protein